MMSMDAGSTSTGVGHRKERGQASSMDAGSTSTDASAP